MSLISIVKKAKTYISRILCAPLLLLLTSCVTVNDSQLFQKGSVKSIVPLLVMEPSVTGISLGWAASRARSFASEPSFQLHRRFREKLIESLVNNGWSVIDIPFDRGENWEIYKRGVETSLIEKLSNEPSGVEGLISIMKSDERVKGADALLLVVPSYGVRRCAKSSGCIVYGQHSGYGLLNTADSGNEVYVTFNYIFVDPATGKEIGFSNNSLHRPVAVGDWWSDFLEYSDSERRLIEQSLIDLFEVNCAAAMSKVVKRNLLDAFSG
ncbi:hypothetical protein [Permianibacter aggregans]|uniref:Lipoprotein n=1 Tax=Permianibacter aggregans TaxID=1510150 RepID=A0A4V3D6W3_9GAMM|nr:hypothetical protein [Permianibacter aggregans]QGX38423.1 hypothetical protein E2H98_01575 [Permianibacter aggregans]TDQ45537.1 hypothetical protein EV696_1195 [Permianibacter aggregans]